MTENFVICLKCDKKMNLIVSSNKKKMCVSKTAVIKKINLITTKRTPLI